MQKNNPQRNREMLQVDNLAELGSLTEVGFIHSCMPEISINLD